MTRIGTYSPSTARYVLDAVRYLRESGFVITPPGARGLLATPQSNIYFHNDTEQNIPAYACMQITGTFEYGGQNYIDVIQPTGSVSQYLFNGPAIVERDGLGTAQSGPILRVLRNTGTVTLGNRWRPTNGQWYLTKGVGHYVVIGEDDIATNVFRVRFDPSIRLYQYQLNAAWAGTPKKAAADILEIDGSDTTIDDDVYDYREIFGTLTTDDYGYCIYQDGKFVAVQAPCGA